MTSNSEFENACETISDQLEVAISISMAVSLLCALKGVITGAKRDIYWEAHEKVDAAFHLMNDASKVLLGKNEEIKYEKDKS